MKLAVPTRRRCTMVYYLLHSKKNPGCTDDVVVVVVVRFAFAWFCMRAYTRFGRLSCRLHSPSWLFRRHIAIRSCSTKEIHALFGVAWRWRCEESEAGLSANSAQAQYVLLSSSTRSSKQIGERDAVSFVLRCAPPVGAMVPCSMGTPGSSTPDCSSRWSVLDWPDSVYVL